MRVYTYKLYFGNSIKAPSTALTAMTLTKEDAVEFTSQVGNDNITYSMTMVGLKYTRKVYEPGTIEAEVSINRKSEKGAEMPEMDDVLKLFENRFVTLGIVSDDVDEVYIAENYYVFKVNPQITMDNNKLTMCVKLTIHSLDKLMTIDKYSKAYVAKKLGSDILEYESRTFGYDTETTLIQPDYDHLRYLKYNHNMLMTDVDNKSVTVSIPSERIQPYLVQYNESFYDFMVRTANRCGEFFYFEDGKLHLGLPDSKAIDIDTYDNVTLQDYTDGPIDTQFYSRDSVKDDEKISGLNSDPIDKDSAGYPTDSFPKKVAQNAELANDEYIFPLEKDKFTSLNREMGMRSDEAASTVLLGAAQEVVGNTEGGLWGVAEVIRSFGISLVNGAISAARSEADKNSGGNDTYINGFKDKSQQSNGTITVPFAAQVKEGWTDRDFYDKIRKHQVEQQHKIICIDMGQNYVDVKLGSKITVKGMTGKYIVIEIRQISNEKWTRNYRRFEEDGSSQDNYSGSQSQIIYAIPILLMVGNTVDMAVPPFANVPLIRKAGPQTAFVVANDDPKYQGRVRIVFPWQSSNDISRKKLYDVQDALATVQAEEAEAKKIVTDLETLLKDLKAQKDEIEALVGKSEEDIKAKREELKDQKTALETRIGELKNQLPEIEKDKVLTKAEYIKRKELKAELNQKELELTFVESLLNLLDGNSGNIDLIISILDDAITTQTETKEQAEKNVKQVQTALTTAQNDVQNAAEGWEKSLSSMATPWVRVATPMACDGGGTFFKPQKGDEVLVNFDNDNIERPYVVGSVFSKNLTAPYNEVDMAGYDMTMMSPNGQYIAFNSPGSAWGFVNGFFPLIGTLQKFIPDLKGDVLKGEEKGLAGDIVMGDRFGMFEVKMSSTKRAINVNSPFGKVDINAFTGITIQAPNGNIKISGKNVPIEAGNNLTLKSGPNVKEKDSAGEIVKQMLIDSAKEIVAEQIGSLKPVDMALIRNVIEIFLRPIEGTLLIKSNNYVMLEAGKGKATVPLERYSKRYQDFKKMETDAIRQFFFAKTIAYVKRIDQHVTAFVEDYKKLKAEAFKQQASYETDLAVFWKDGTAKPEVLKTVFKLGKNEYKPTSDPSATFKMDDFKSENYKYGIIFTLKNGNFVSRRSIRNHMEPLVDSYANAIDALQKKAHRFGEIFNDETIRLVNQSLFHKDSDNNTKWVDDAFKAAVYDAANGLVKKTADDWNSRYGAEGSDPKAEFLKVGDENSKDDPFFDATTLKRMIIATFLLKLHDDINNKKDPTQTIKEYSKYLPLSYDAVDEKLVKDYWNKVIALGDNVKVSDGFKKKGMSLLKIAGEITDLESWCKQIYDPDKPLGGWAHTVWNEKSGQIIFSSEKNATYALNGESIDKYSMDSSMNIDKLKSALSDVS